MENKTETDLNKKTSIKQNQKITQINSPVAKKKGLTAIQNYKIQAPISMRKNTKKSISANKTGEKSEQESVFFFSGFSLIRL